MRAKTRQEVEKTRAPCLERKDLQESARWGRYEVIITSDNDHNKTQGLDSSVEVSESDVGFECTPTS